MSNDNIPKSEVPESSEYQNLINVKSKKTNEPKSLLDFMDLTEEEKKDQNEDKEWKRYWKGMPEFEQEANKPYKTLYVHFESQEDFDEFSNLIGQKLTSKTKSIWHPKLDRTKNSLLRWIEEE